MHMQLRMSCILTCICKILAGVEGAVLESDISLGRRFDHSTLVRQASSAVHFSGDQQEHQP